MSDSGARVAAEAALNDLVARYPVTLGVLTRYGLDTCCGGALSLREAARHHDVDLDDLLGDINASIAGPRGT